MLGISTFQVELRHPDGSIEQLQVDSERMLLGSGAHCEIRLPREQSPTEALLIEAKSAGIFAEARAFDPPPTVNGTPFTRGRLLPDAIIKIGNVDISVRVVEGTTHAAKQSKQKSSNYVTYVAALLMMAGGGFLLLGSETDTLASLKAPPAPPLWAHQTDEKCPHADAVPAAAFATEQRVLAEGKRERAPFHLEDGVAAVKYLERAAACYKAAGDVGREQEARSTSDSLRTRMNDEFHVHQVRLERALASAEYDGARTEVRLLLALLRGRKEEYVSYLSSLDRVIDLKLTGSKSGRQ